MRKLLFSSLLCGLYATAALAQRERNLDQDQYNGKWKVIIQPSVGKPRSAELVLTAAAGVWYSGIMTTDRTKAKLCNRKRFPVTVNEEINESGLEFTAWGSSVSPKCPDVAVTVRTVNANMLEGTLATGESIKLLRE